MKKTRSMDYMGAVLGFKKVFDMQSYSKASLALEISQPALSKRVYNLEKLYNTDLIIKKNGTMTLTKVGKLIYDEAVQFEKIYKDTEEKIKRCKSSTKKKMIGIDEQVYLNFINDEKNYKDIEFIRYDNEHKMRKNFESKVIDGLIVQDSCLNRFAHGYRHNFATVEVQFYVHSQNENVQKENLKFITSNKQLIFQRNNMSSLLTQFLNDNKLLNNDFEYIDNYDIMYAKMLLSKEQVCITTNQKPIPTKYLDIVKEIKLDVPSIDLYLITK